MWTHLARTEAGIDAMIFPRLLALAEVLWTAPEHRDWNRFAPRLRLHEKVLASREVHCFVRNEGLPLPSITAGQDGRLWLVNAAGAIYGRSDGTWQQMPGTARQVTSGPDGAVWAVSDRPAKGGYLLMRWSGTQWEPIGHDAAAVQITAAPDGSLWAVTDAYAIYRFAEGRWANVIGLAREIVAGADGTVWILTTDPGPGGYELHAARGTRWRRIEPLAAGVHIAAGATGELLLMRDDGAVRQLVGSRWADVSVR